MYNPRACYKGRHLVHRDRFGIDKPSNNLLGELHTWHTLLHLVHLEHLFHSVQSVLKQILIALSTDDVCTESVLCAQFELCAQTELQKPPNLDLDPDQV